MYIQKIRKAGSHRFPLVIFRNTERVVCWKQFPSISFDHKDTSAYTIRMQE